jgi:hypothetical protein
MASPTAVLPRQRPDPYRPGVARRPKDFRIDSVSIELLQPEGYYSTGPDTAVPARFEASIVLGSPEASVTIEVLVYSDGPPRVIDLAIRPRARMPVTTTLLRQVLVDQLLQAALERATVPATTRDDWIASLPPQLRPESSTEKIIDTQRAMPTPTERGDSDAQVAAQLYKAAAASGHRTPIVDVASTMRKSERQVARYLRRARELGFLDPARGAGK